VKGCFRLLCYLVYNNIFYILFNWNGYVEVQINLLMVENCSVLLILITFESLVFCPLVENITKYKMQVGYHDIITA